MHDREFIEMICNQMNLDAKLYPEHSTPGRSHEYLDSLSDSHIVLLLVPEKESKPVQEEIKCARNNGIPIIAFFKVRPGASTSYESVKMRAQKFKMDHSTEHACIYSRLEDLSHGVKKGIAAILANRMSDRLVLDPWTADVYEQARIFIPSAGSRMAIAQSTSTFILGPKINRIQEKSFHRECLEFIRSILSGHDSKFLHVFDRNATMDAINNQRDNYPKLKDSIDGLENIIPNIKVSSKVKFILSDINVAPAIVGDDRFQVATIFGDQRFYMWLSESRKGANRLWEILNEIKSIQSLEDFIKEVKLIL